MPDDVAAPALPAGSTDTAAGAQQGSGGGETPAKFEGKTEEDIRSAYRNLEQELGRMRNEVHQARSEKQALESLLFSGQVPQPTPGASAPEGQGQPVKPGKSVDEYVAEGDMAAAIRAAQEPLIRQVERATSMTELGLYAMRNPDFVTLAPRMGQLIQENPILRSAPIPVVHELAKLKGELEALKAKGSAPATPAPSQPPPSVEGPAASLPAGPDKDGALRRFLNQRGVTRDPTELLRQRIPNPFRQG